jgi:ABC-2 type transport system permease protein
VSDRGSASALRTIALVARRELVERLRTKSFYILTGILVLIVLAIGVVSRVAGDRGPGELTIGVTEPVPAGLADALTAIAATADREASVVALGDADEARVAVEAGDVDLVIVGAQREIVSDAALDDETVVIVQQAWASAAVRQSLLDAGLRADTVADALSPAPLTPVTLDDDAETAGLAMLAGTATAVLLFLSLQTFGGYVLTGVVEEKSTAVVEVLLVRLRSDQLLAGKVVGIGLAALLQFTLAVLTGLVSLAISGVDVPGEVWSTIPMSVVWFLGGYALYSMLFALAGSLVTRQEDAQAASAPILSALTAAYFVVFIFGYAPESTASRVMSVIPPIAPLLMPMRMAAGAASVLEVALALVLLSACIFGVWKLAGRIFEQVLLQRGTRIGWRAALSLARSD